MLMQKVHGTPILGCPQSLRGVRLGSKKEIGVLDLKKKKKKKTPPFWGGGGFFSFGEESRNEMMPWTM